VAELRAGYCPVAKVGLFLQLGQAAPTDCREIARCRLQAILDDRDRPYYAHRLAA